jgi:hypothetical protein
MDRILGTGGLRTAATALLAFATLLFAAPAPSMASSYTLAFTGTVTSIDTAVGPNGSVFQALGIVPGDTVTGTLKFDPFNTTTYTMPDATTHAFSQPAALSFQVSHPGAAVSFAENGAGTAYAGTETVAGRTRAGIAFDFNSPDDYLNIFYLTDGSLTPLGTLDALPASSSDIIAFLGGASPEAAGEFRFGGTSGLNFDINFATTPIPAALPLFASALAGLGFVGWRRKRATATAI